MKCPKCGYLGYDSGDRCRNCGYDFSLVDRAGVRQAGQTPPSRAVDGAARDPRLARGARYRQETPPPADSSVDRALTAAPEGTPLDLPLFGGGAPVIPPPRPPLSVRRATPTPARARSRPVTPQPEALPLMLDEPPAPPVAAAGLDARSRDTRTAREDSGPATPGRRAAAAVIDAGLVVLVDLVVLHFTLALCGLTFNDLHVLPVVPMTAFLLLLNGGYLILFTGTLGQTLGKMVTAIEVVADRQAAMTLRCATLRAAALILSVLPVGLGWFAGLVGDGRGLHDRLAGTRVVRAARA